MYAAIGDSRLMVRAARSTVFIATSISSSFSLSISSYECAGAVPLFVVSKRFSFPVHFITEGVPQARGPRAESGLHLHRSSRSSVVYNTRKPRRTIHVAHQRRSSEFYRRNIARDDQLPRMDGRWLGHFVL